jgi:small-conductance mechanosensitive channel
MIAGVPSGYRMAPLASFWRRLPALVIACVVLVALQSGIAFAKDAAPAPAKLPEPLTPETARELVSRLSDQEVRNLLLQQLDRAAARPAEKQQATSATGMLGAVNRGAGAARDGIVEIVTAVATMPEAVRTVVGNLSEPDGIGVLGIALGMFVLALVVAALVELVVRRASRAWREDLRTRPSEGLLSDTVRLLMRAALEVGYVLVFGAVVLGIFLMLWQGHEGRRILLLGLLGAVVIARIVFAFANLLLAPARPEARLLPLDDGSAGTLTRAVTTVAALFGLIVATKNTFLATGSDLAHVEAIALVLGVAIVGVCIFAVWRVRSSIGDLIRRAGGNGPIANWVADLWPFAAIVYLLSVFFGRVWEAITGVPGRGEGILSLAILVALPVVDFALSKTLISAAAAARTDRPSILAGLVTSYEPVLRRLIHILVVVGGVLALAKIWALDLFGMAERSLGGQIASALLGIGLVLLIAYIVWEIARTAIDRRIAEEANVPEGSTTSRLRTLLPLLRIFIAITLVVMTVLSVLAALGVNIVPLLAGASIVGVAIGFGSQTLVKDIVSGAFFLMDDAFRVGEYIEVGDAKGTVEKITVRALFLRHHRGALNILPYGQIARLRNTSRDWMIMILEFRLALETDLRKVKKIIKTIGDEIAADPELAPALLTPVKSGGVIATDDSSITVRVKYTARPGDGAFMVRRVAYEKILKAFAANGIEFASRRVAVYVPPGEERSAGRIAAAALPVIEAQELQDKGKAP